MSGVDRALVGKGCWPNGGTGVIVRRACNTTARTC